MNHIKFGMPTLLEMDSIEKNVQLCCELGLDFIEINMCMPEYLPGSIDTALFLEMKKKYGTEFTIHMPDNFNPFDFNPHIAEAWQKTTAETIILAKNLGVKLINIHLAAGDYFTLPDRRVYIYEKYIESYLSTIRVFRDFCEKQIGQDDILICIENCDGFTDFHLSALEILLDSDKFGLTLDIGHNCGSDYVDEPYIQAHAEKLSHMHIHDAVGKRNHLPLGEGKLDLYKYLTFGAQHNCTMVLETKTIEGLKKSVKWIKNQ